MSDYPMTQIELEKLTGCKTSEGQLELLRRMGLNPWTHPDTGQVVLYKEAVIQNMASTNSTTGDGFEMNYG